MGASGALAPMVARTAALSEQYVGYVLEKVVCYERLLCARTRRKLLQYPATLLTEKRPGQDKYARSPPPRRTAAPTL